LEIGVRYGRTFFPVALPLKIAVDPAFGFDPAKHAKEGEIYLPITSDAFFDTFAQHPKAGLFAEPDGTLAFDVIFIDGLHTFAQSYRDFENSLRFSHDNTLWIIDDTVPDDVFSSHPTQGLAGRLRRQAGILGVTWHGDVYKTLMAIHDFHPECSYVTTMTKGNPQTVLWKTPSFDAGHARRPRFGSLERIDALGYLDILDNADLFHPVDDEQVPSLIGQRVDFPPEGSDNAWKKLLYRKIVSVQEQALKKKVDTLLAENKALLEKIAALEMENKTAPVPANPMAPENNESASSIRKNFFT
jgi:hypothetical protein